LGQRFIIAEPALESYHEHDRNMIGILTSVSPPEANEDTVQLQVERMTYNAHTPLEKEKSNTNSA